jgi:hypothetical protein
MSLPVVVSKFWIDNMKTTNVSRKGHFVQTKYFYSQIFATRCTARLESFNLSRRVARNYSFGVKRPGSEADLSPQSIAKVKNDQTYTSILSHTYIMRTGKTLYFYLAYAIHT